MISDFFAQKGMFCVVRVGKNVFLHLILVNALNQNFCIITTWCMIEGRCL